MIFRNDPDWLINSLMQTVACLPHLTELDVDTWEDAHQSRIPLGLFSNLSKLWVECGPYDVSFFISQMSNVIANSPQLQSLIVSYVGLSYTRPTLSELLAKISAKNPLYLEHLSIGYMDATVDQVVLPHLTHLTSFQFRGSSIGDPSQNLSIAQSVWTSFLVNDVRLSDVDVQGSMTEEMLLYLSSFSGLKRLVVGAVIDSPGVITENLAKMLFTAVLQKHVNTLQTLEIMGSNDDGPWVKLILALSAELLSP
jgi:hypothetical protein